MSFFTGLFEFLGLTPRPSAVPPAYVDSNWLRVPSLAPGRPFSIVGESHYQHALEALSGGRNEDGTITRWITVVLEADPSNRHDRRAIRVVANGHIVGHIPRDQTSLFHPTLRQIEAPCLVRARLTGGWDRGPDDRGFIGVELHLDWPLAPMTDSSPFLPAEADVALTGEEHCPPLQCELGASFAASLQVIDTNQLRPNLAGPFVLAMRGSQPLGWLTPTMTPRYLPLIREVAAAGIVPTVRAVALEGRRCPQVKVSLPSTA